MVTERIGDIWRPAALGFGLLLALGGFFINQPNEARVLVFFGRYVGTVSRPHTSPEWTGCTGRVETIVAAQLDEHGLEAGNTTIYLCGNPDMVSAVEEIALARGFPPEQVRKELYWPKGREHR